MQQGRVTDVVPDDHPVEAHPVVDDLVAAMNENSSNYIDCYYYCPILLLCTWLPVC